MMTEAGTKTTACMLESLAEFTLQLISNCNSSCECRL